MQGSSGANNCKHNDTKFIQNKQTYINIDFVSDMRE